MAVTGVSGSGKSTVGAALAERLAVPFLDGDALHPTANVAKMRAGLPLDDEDRWPWLDRVGAWLARHEAGGGVIACSALRRTYRERILTAAPSTRFVWLTAPAELIAERLATRSHAFMPATLLESQLATLEPLDPDEPGVAVDASAPLADVVAQALALG
ncbi:gluconokinase [Nocardioides sp. MH1]|uniref:gluconokinase n=1 Tax=Nocardioides sp. MH1 TaxID=3242490 RepID=UPI00351FEC07